MDTESTMVTASAATAADLTSAADAAPDATVPASAPAVSSAGSNAAADRALETTRVIWHQLGTTMLCLRVHGLADRYVMGARCSYERRSGRVCVQTLWPAPTAYAGRTWSLAAFGGDALALPGALGVAA